MNKEKIVPRGREKRKMRKTGRNRQQPPAAPFNVLRGKAKREKHGRKIPGAGSVRKE